MLTQKFYYIEDMAKILGKTAAAIHGHLARKQYDAVPPPIRLGRKLAWLVEAVDEWISAKVSFAKAELEKQMQQIQAPPKRRGRPSKLEIIRRRKEFSETEILRTFEAKNGKS
jgi:predicted DNA-binding transcriptional regulator AlpA